MAVHRVPRDTVERFVANIEVDERIVSVVESGDGALLVFTEPRKRVGRPPAAGKEIR